MSARVRSIASRRAPPRLDGRSRRSAKLRVAKWLAAASLAIATLAFAGAATGQPDAASPSARIAQGIDAYGAAMEASDRDARLDGFRRAERAFAAAIESGAASAELYANLGNAALQAERTGAAVLAYRRALLLDPTLERARQNLGQLRAQLPDWVPVPEEGGAFDTFFFWHHSVSHGAKAELAALMFFAFAALLAASLLLRAPLLRTASFAPLTAWVVLLASLALDPTRSARDEAVVVAEEAIARSADSINAPSRFGEPLPAGTEVAIVEDRGGWLQIRLANGRSAWLTRSQIERLRED